MAPLWSRRGSVPAHCACVCKKAASKDSFVVEARESFWIRKYDCVKRKSVKDIEHGLNMK